MPQLSYAGRRWKIAGDEFPLPVLCSATLRLFWSFSLIAIFAYSVNRLSDCGNGWLILTYLLFSIVVFLLSIFCEMSIFRISLMGTMVESNPRKNLGIYLNMHVVLGAFQIVLALFGFFVAELASFPCSDEFYSRADQILMSVVVISQLADVLCQLCCCYLTKAKDRDESSGASKDYDETIEWWKSKCKVWCKNIQICTCNLFGGVDIVEDLETVARVLTDFFHHDGFLDVVASDVVAGIVLVRLELRANRSKEQVLLSVSPLSSPALISSSRSGSTNSSDEENLLVSGVRQGVIRELLPSRDEDSDVIGDFMYYAPYFLSVYTSYLMMFMNPLSGTCRMGRECFKSGGLCPCLCCSSSSKNAVGDNCCACHHAATLAFTRKNDCETIYCNYENKFCPTFAVFYDHTKKTIVIAVRGTMSLEDCVRDMNIQPSEMTDAGELYGFDGSGRYAHRGMLKSAMYIRRHIQEMQIFESIHQRFSTPQVEIPSMSSPLNDKGLDIVIVGHSLGAGIAAVLTKLYISEYQQRIRCITYGIPGTAVDPITAEELKPYVNNISHNNDLIPTLSVSSVMRLRRQVLFAISRAKVSKTHIMQSLFRNRIETVDDLMYPHDDIPDSSFLRSVRAFDAKMLAKEADFAKVPLVIPGKNYHMQRVEKGSCLCGKLPVMKLFEVSTEYYRNIPISPTMFFDHFPDRYATVLENFRNYWT